MNLILLFSLVMFGDDVYSFKADHAVKVQSKSIFSNRKYTETITPARYNVGNRDIKNDRSASDNFTPEPYFPEVEYPANIMEASKPFYFKTAAAGNNEILTHFEDDVKMNFKSLATKPAYEKTNSKTLNEYKRIPKSVNPNEEIISETSKESNMIPIVTEPIMTTEEEDLIELILNEIPEELIEQSIPQDETNSDKKNTTMPATIISPEPETLEIIGDTEHVADCSKASSDENVTTDYYYEDVEIFNSDELVFESASFEDSYPSILDIETYNDNSTNNSISQECAQAAVSSGTTMVSNGTDPSIGNNCPLSSDKNKTNVVEKPPKKLTLKPVQNVKKKKLLQRMYQTPSMIPYL